MATVNDLAYVYKIIAANGKLYEDGSPVVKIVQYDNAWGGIGYGLIFEGESLDKYNVDTDGYIRNPKVLFERKEEK